MPARKKNKTWTLRSSHGRGYTFKDADTLLSAAGEYFAWADNNPWYMNEPVKHGEHAGSIIKVPTQRPYTLEALVHFLDIDFTTWRLYKNRNDFKSSVDTIENFIYNQKFEGAAVGAFNANIISRQLGLSDKKDLTTNGESLNNQHRPDFSKLNDEELDTLEKLYLKMSCTWAK
jgi:hypothetical protein